MSAGRQGSVAKAGKRDSMPRPAGKLATGSIAALGVVYGEVGTSPLYTMREVFGHGLPAGGEQILGVLSLIFWSLIVVVSLKYLVFVMRAGNRGEGGIMALMALALRHRHRHRQRSLIVMLGLFGTALFYGDGIITPAISVMSAVEGLQVATPIFRPYVAPISIGVLFGLFLLQKRGTGRVGWIFGPIMLVWFLTLAVLGVMNIMETREVLAALDPRHALNFLFEQGRHAFFALGAVMLALTGAEALYADMGHFGPRPIRIAWAGLVLPALVCNYFGQGALLLRDASAVENPFYHLVPASQLYPLVALSTTATVIASQAVISGAFSITQQAMQLDYIPHLQLVHTSGEERGQIYVPLMNQLLLGLVVAVVLGFQSSTNLAAAYGLAVTGTMFITTLLVMVVARDDWHWRRLAAGGLFGLFLLVDLAFFSANLAKIPEGGWFSLGMASLIFVVMFAWRRGREVLAAQFTRSAISLVNFLKDLQQAPPIRVPGTAVFMTSRHLSLPAPLLSNFQKNEVLHETVILLTVMIRDEPYVNLDSRLDAEDLGQGFYRLTLYYGFMQHPNIPMGLAMARDKGLDIALEQVAYFIGHESLLLDEEVDLNPWLARLFIYMSRNATNPVLFYRIPLDRVMELGVLVRI
jgi:KUP system potassium uptake protein